MGNKAENLLESLSRGSNDKFYVTRMPIFSLYDADGISLHAQIDRDDTDRGQFKFDEIGRDKAALPSGIRPEDRSVFLRDISPLLLDGILSRDRYGRI